MHKCNSLRYLNSDLKLPTMDIASNIKTAVVMAHDAASSKNIALPYKQLNSFHLTHLYFNNRSVTCFNQSYICNDFPPVYPCRPIINSKFEEKTCGDGPSLATMFDDDKYLQTLIHNIRVWFCVCCAPWTLNFLYVTQWFTENSSHTLCPQSLSTQLCIHLTMLWCYVLLFGCCSEECHIATNLISKKNPEAN